MLHPHSRLRVAEPYHAYLNRLAIKLSWLKTVRILFVVDTEVSIQPADFGLSIVIAHLRTAGLDDFEFVVDVAQRDGGPPTTVNSPGPGDLKYRGFRFDMRTADGASNVVDGYHEIWCFGFKPGNFSTSDDDIERSFNFPVSTSELAVLSRWMREKKGGVFATGDHSILGASMCAAIPRVGSMRRWKFAHDVPPQFSERRIDTLRPANAAEADIGSNAPDRPATISNSNERDAVTQPIQWHPWARVRTSWARVRVRPHPVLCHPDLGPIDVMPDHPHEGLVRDTGTIGLDDVHDFDGDGERPEYPTSASGDRPEPLVIAYGSTLGTPPYALDKGDQPARDRFPMISVYDGHRAGVGRVATDSTWHHWFDMNVERIQAAGGDDWSKIGRYYVNLAQWLMPPVHLKKYVVELIYRSHFQYPGFQEYGERVEPAAMGRAFRQHVGLIYGPCWITQFLLDVLPHFEERFLREYRRLIEGPCLLCPPLDLLEDTILGGMIAATLDEAAQARRMLDHGEQPKTPDADALEKRMLAGVPAALDVLRVEWEKSLKRGAETLSALPRVANRKA